MRRSLLLSLFFAGTIVLHAGNTGKISGRVYDKSTKEPLVGANVLIVGTNLGGTADIQGRYVILNIPAGIYEVRASYIGYRNVLTTNVRIVPDLTTELNFELPSVAIELEEVVVVAERKLIQKDATSTVSTLDHQQLQSLPVTTFTQALVIAPGFVSSNNNSGDDGIHLRGGRTGELSFVIDGVRVDDPLYGGLAMDLPRTGISSLTVMSGTFNAEYGDAQAGIINITTPEGSKNYQGSMRFGTDQLGLASNNWHSSRVEATLQGPFPLMDGNTLSFFLSGDYSNTKSYLNYVAGPRYTSPGGREIQNHFDFGLYDRKQRINGKLTFRPISDIKLNISSAYASRENKNYNHYYKQTPEFAGRERNESQIHSVNYVHTLSPTTFYDIKFSYFERQALQYLFEEDLSGDITTRFRRIFYPVSSAVAFDSTSNYEFAGEYASEINLEDALAWGYRTLGSNLLDTNGVRIGNRGDQLTDQMANILRAQGIGTIVVMVPSMDNFYGDNTTITRTIAASISSQITRSHLIKAGAEMKFFTIRNFWISGINSYWNHIDDNYDFWKRHSEVTAYTFTPMQASVYLQDKMEFDDIILNVGVRFDYLDTKSPDIYSIINNPQDSALFNQNVSPKMHISPRIGFAHPVTDRIKFRFSYGQFYQYPDFNFIYRRFNQFDDAYPVPNLGQGYEPSIGNPNLKPEVTQSYEFGSEIEVSDDMLASLTIFYKDTYDYISTMRVDRSSGAYTQIVNMDYANSRGVEIALRKRLSKNYAFQINYTYSRAEGNADYWGEHADEAYLASVYGIVAPKRTLTLGWDQPHTLNFTFSLDYQSWGASFVGQYGSGLPYTPADARGKPVGDRNSGRMPWTGTVDMRAYKRVPLTEDVYIMLFADVTNLLNTTNIYNVFQSTGKPDYTLNPNVSVENRHRPMWFGPMRHIEAGLEIGF